MGRHKYKAISNRHVRLADQIQKDLSVLIQREIDTARGGMITVSGIDLSADYAHAKVYFTVFGMAPERATQLLNKKAGWLHSQLYRLLHIHHVPTLLFIYDARVAHGMEMLTLIERANQSDVATASCEESSDSS